MALGPNRSASMSSGLLLDPMPSPNSDPPPVGPRFRPYASPNHHVTKGRYITSNDPRGYIPVYEYPLNGQWIMLDMDDGYVLWTGIWKALGNNKADIVKIIDSQPDLASQLRRVRGGYLKIQGTWMPYETAMRLARRVAWPIRHDLVPLFGPTFPSSCLSPDQPGYGQIVSPGTGKRRARRSVQADFPADPRHSWTVISSVPGPSNAADPAFSARQFHQQQALYSGAGAGDQHAVIRGDSPVMLHVPYVERPQLQQQIASPATSYRQSVARRVSPPVETTSSMRYSPYPPSPLTSRPAMGHAHESLLPQRTSSLTLPSIHSQRRDSLRAEAVTLPPISSLDVGRRGSMDDSTAVLKRLRSDDDDTLQRSAREPPLPLPPRRQSIPDALHSHRSSDGFMPHGGLAPLASSRASSSSTLSPPLSSSSHGSPLTPAASSASYLSPMPPSWERYAMPPPPSPSRNVAYTRDVADYERSHERAYYNTAQSESDRESEKRTWRPW